MLQRFLQNKYSHLIILVLIICSVGILFFLIRTKFFVPESFYLKGHYRYNAVYDERLRSHILQSSERCLDCHFEKVYRFWKKGRHSSVECEICHDSGRQHVLKGGGLKVAIKVDRNKNACLICHQKVIGKPQDFPQIVLQRHYNQRKNKNKLCIDCHNPHYPMEITNGEKKRKRFFR